MQGRTETEKSESTHGEGEKEMSEGRKQKKKGGIYRVKEGESATGSFSASYRWPPASAFRHRGIPGRGQGGREGARREGGTERGGWVILAVCCQMGLLHEKGRAHAFKAISLRGCTLTFLLRCRTLV